MIELLLADQTFVLRMFYKHRTDQSASDFVCICLQMVNVFCVIRILGKFYRNAVRPKTTVSEKGTCEARIHNGNVFVCFFETTTATATLVAYSSCIHHIS